LVDPWKELGIGRTRDVRLIKKAYAARLKYVHPEDDTAGFQRLREAYEAALALVRWEAAQCASEPHPDPFGSAERPPTPFSAESEEPERHAPRPPRVHWGPRPHGQVAPEADPASSAAHALARELDGLWQDPRRRASNRAWRKLLASASLWHVDTRGWFEQELIRRLLAHEIVLAPETWDLMESEFGWSELALAVRDLPPSAVADLLERRKLAPVEFAERLCDDGEIEDAKARALAVAKDRTANRSLVRAARALLDRCRVEERAREAMLEVERLLEDASSPSSLVAWRAILGHAVLRQPEVRHAFAGQLLRRFATLGRVPSAAVWRLLDGELAWSEERPPVRLTRAASVLGPLIVELAETLHAEGRHDDVVLKLGGVLDALAGEPARRARLVFDLSSRALLDDANSLEHAGRHLDAIARVRDIADTQSEPGKAARALLERCEEEVLRRAGRLREKRRRSEAVELLTRAVDSLPRPFGTRTRLMLARCRLEQRAHAEAEILLDEVLADEPANVEALLVLAEVTRASDQLARAEAAGRRVLMLDPHNETAAQILKRLESEQHAVEAQAQRYDGSGVPGIVFWLPLLALLNLPRSCSVTQDLAEADLMKPLAVVVVIVVILALGMIFFGGRTPSRLHLAGEEPPAEPRRSRLAKVAAVAVALGVLAFLAWGSQPTWRARQPGTPAAAEPDHRQAAQTIDRSRLAYPYGARQNGLPQRPAAWSGRVGSRAKDVRILQLGPEQLPLRQGTRITLWADVRYELSSAPGELKLFAEARPGGVAREVASAFVHNTAGEMRLQGDYLVPHGASRVLVAVPLYAAGTANPVVAHADVAVE
jgi:tetratricopeptide (TPR) repeat protein